MINHSTVHVVDDDEAVRDSTRILLESYGHPVQDYSSARAFLDANPKSPQGCLVLDIHMPGMSGLELLEEMRARKFSLPVIVITGRYDAALGARLREAGAMDVLMKPVDDAELKAKIDRALDRA